MRKYSEEELLKMLAEQIALETEAELLKVEENLSEVPEDLDKKTRSMLHELMLKEKRKSNINALKRVAAILIVCFSAVNMFAFTVSEAYREKLLTLIPHEKDGSVHLLNENESDLLEGWNDYWYPEYLPEGYRLVAADNEGTQILIFASDFDDSVISVEQYSDNAGMAFNAEGVDYRSIGINSFDGMIFVDETYESVLLVWRAEGSIIQIYLSNSADEDVAIKIAENMVFRK